MRGKGKREAQPTRCICASCNRYATERHVHANGRSAVIAVPEGAGTCFGHVLPYERLPSLFSFARRQDR